MPLVYGGIGIAVIVAALVAFLFIRRKPSGVVVAHGAASGSRDPSVDFVSSHTVTAPKARLFQGLAQ